MRPDVEAIKKLVTKAQSEDWLCKNYPRQISFAMDMRGELPDLLAYVEKLEKVAEATRQWLDSTLPGSFEPVSACMAAIRELDEGTDETCELDEGTDET